RARRVRDHRHPGRDPPPRCLPAASPRDRVAALVKMRTLLALLALAGCAHAGASRPTCLVLSVGGADGVAHLGALAAIKQRRLPISCVVGSSMGALVGAIYASAPADDARLRFEALVRDYAETSAREARRNGLGL